MSLPITARVVTIVVMRPIAVSPGDVDEWNRTVRNRDDAGDPPEVLRTIGDLQPIRRPAAERPQSEGGGVAFGSHNAFTEVLDIRTADLLRLEPDDGQRYNVTAVSRPGIGRRLDHLEIRCEQVTSGAVRVVNG